MRTPLTQFRIPSDLKEQFKKVCEQKGLTMADVVKTLIEDYVFVNTVGLDQSTEIINTQVEDDWRSEL
jgi:antitoxin component of RelBE/YafQ-DinJ toxin-antitoxin module|tara:strand:+ start:133 stop:336 length:204 start_codon:yes stop_codon:yes gene_type:complete